MRKVVVFDFDGTLTTKDSYLEFVKYACGYWHLVGGLLLFSPLLLLMLCHLYPHGKAKERVFSHFFKGWRYSQFQKVGREFAHKVKAFERTSTVEILEKEVKAGSTVYVVSASMEDWIRPWSQQKQVAQVLGTKAEVDADGMLTGKFSTPNCFGQEKVSRLLEVEPDRKAYRLEAYGDSRGDREMIAFADRGIYV
ncbi:MAG: HAD-IB family hydrolase [Bacteroidaceae bacterium]|nr:HAD-IB family hydrolase [Bacteroidaceae bacterium]